TSDESDGPPSREELAERLAEVIERRKILVLSPAEQERLDEERKRLEEQVFGETAERQSARAAQQFGLIPRGTTPPPQKPVATRQKLAEERALRERGQASRDQLGPNAFVPTHVPATREAQLQQAAVRAGIPARTFQRPRTDFE